MGADDGGFFLDDRVEPVYSDICTRCRHNTGYRTCKAFEEIPYLIWLGENDHKKPYPGDGGIQFAPYTEEEIDEMRRKLKNKGA